MRGNNRSWVRCTRHQDRSGATAREGAAGMAWCGEATTLDAQTAGGNCHPCGAAVWDPVPRPSTQTRTCLKSEFRALNHVKGTKSGLERRQVCGGSTRVRSLLGRLLGGIRRSTLGRLGHVLGRLLGTLRGRVLCRLSGRGGHTSVRIFWRAGPVDESPSKQSANVEAWPHQSICARTNLSGRIRFVLRGLQVMTNGSAYRAASEMLAEDDHRRTGSAEKAGRKRV